jgi:hypothetical protein
MIIPASRRAYYLRLIIARPTPGGKPVIVRAAQVISMRRSVAAMTALALGYLVRPELALVWERVG